MALNLDAFVRSAPQVFDELLMKTVTCWNTLAFGYMELGSMADGQKNFHLMPEISNVSWTTLVNGYIRSNQIAKVQSVLNDMKEKNKVSQIAMISGLFHLL